MFKEIYTLLDNQEFDTSLDKLYLLINDKSLTAQQLAQSYFLIASIFNNYRFKKNDSKMAKQNYLNALDYSPDNQVIIESAFPLLKDEEREPLIEIVLKQDRIRYRLLCHFASYYWRNDASKIHTIFSFLQLDELDKYDKNYWDMLNGFALCLLGSEKNILEAKAIFKKLDNEDVLRYLNYAPSFGLIWCYIKLQQFDDVIKQFDMLPTYGLSDFLEGPGAIVPVDFTKIYALIFDDLNALISNDKVRRQRCACIYSLYKATTYIDYEIDNFTKMDIQNIQRYYNKHQDEYNLCEILIGLYSCKMNKYQAYMCFISLLQSINRVNWTNIYIDFDDTPQDQLVKITNHIAQELPRIDEDDLDIFFRIILTPVIDVLYPQKCYHLIVKFAKSLNLSYFRDFESIFELAYACGEYEDVLYIAKDLYKMILEKTPAHSSAINNLGVIYEKNGELDKAVGCFEKAHSINPKEPLYKRNCDRVNNLIMQEKKIFESFLKEDIEFQILLNQVHNKFDDKGTLLSDESDMATLFRNTVQNPKCDYSKCIKKKYLKVIDIQNKDSFYGTSIHFNRFIHEYLYQNNEKYIQNRELIEIKKNLSLDSLQKLGYTPENIALINKLSDMQFRNLVKRDFKESAISLCLCQYKAAIVMIGSTIESLLMNKLLENGITKYDIGALKNGKAKTKTVKSMGMEELILVAQDCTLISKNAYHLSQFSRSYRNIIHPACELRANVIVAPDEAELLWRILLKIIQEVLS